MWPGRRIASSASATATSLPPQRLNRRKPERAPGRIRGADHGDAERKREAPREDSGREVRAHEPGRAGVVAEDVCSEDAEPEPHAEREPRDPDRLADDERADPPG